MARSSNSGEVIYHTCMIRRLFLLITTLGVLLSPVSGHQVDTVEFEFQQLDGTWRLHGQMDIAYMLPEVRWVEGAGPMDRMEVMKAPPRELERIRSETENTLRKYLSLSHGGKPLRWRIEFPDFKKQPFALPPDFGGYALLTVNLVVDEQRALGEFKVHWSNQEKATLIVLDELSNDGVPIAIEPGGSLSLLKVTRGNGAQIHSKGGELSTESKAASVEHVDNSVAYSWLKSGFLHVVPKGLDHMLFILGLFLAVLTLKPMLWQSLLFTVAHSITLGACALGWLAQWTWVEIFIAFTIAFIGIENLFKVKVGKRRYITVFAFGLVHGLGFASVFVEQISGVSEDKLLQPLLWFNIGVEVAQVSVIIVAALLFSMIKKKKTRERAQMAGSALIAAAGLIWMAQRIFGIDLTWGLF